MIIGGHHSWKTKEKIRIARIGKKHSEEVKAKMSESKQGEKHPRYGKHVSMDIRKKISNSTRGNKHWRWGIRKNRCVECNNPTSGVRVLRCLPCYKVYILKKYTGCSKSRGRQAYKRLRTKIMKTKEYKSWRKSILDRDKRSCVWCGNKKNICVDHIKSFAQFPELRLSLDNGRTLCNECHQKTDNFGWRAWAS